MGMYQELTPGGEEFRKTFGPGAVDEMIRQAVKICWMMLPEDRRSVDQVEQDVRRILDRILEDWREDARRFGIG